MSTAETEVIGLMDVSLGVDRRVPVTMTSCNTGEDSVVVVAATVCVCASATGTAAAAAAVASTARIANCNLRLFPICCSLTFFERTKSSMPPPMAYDFLEFPSHGQTDVWLDYSTQFRCCQDASTVIAPMRGRPMAAPLGSR